MSTLSTLPGPESDYPVITMEVTVITEFDEIGRNGDEIDRFIADPDTESNVYHQSIYLGTFLAHAAKPGQWRLLLFRHNGRLEAVTAFFVRQARMDIRFGLYSLLRIKLKMLQFVGHSVAYRKNADLSAIYRQLDHFLTHEGPAFDLGMIEAIDIGNPMFEAFFSRQRGKLVLDTVSPRNEVIRYLEFPPSWDDYLASMSKKTRYNLKRAVKIFSATFDSRIRLERYSTADEVIAFLDAKNDIFADTWPAKTLPDFAGRETWERQENTAMAQAGCFKSYVLYGAEEPIAYLRGYQYKNFYYFEEIGYKQRWAGISPGTVLNYLFLEELMSSSDAPAKLSFGYGENHYKKIFGNSEIEANQAYLYRFDSRIRYLLALRRFLDAVYHLLKNLLTRLGIDAYVRRLLKGKKTKSR